MSVPSPQRRRDGLDELLSELIDAHLDTIGLLVGDGDVPGSAAHLDYLRGLVRASKTLIARAGL